MRTKTITDSHWNQRAKLHDNELEVNIGDVQQRNLEDEFIIRHLAKEDKVLEVGCGNGYSTSTFRKYVKHIDAFDYSEEMVKRGREVFGETNNRFFVDDLLYPKTVTETYDKVICVRVLINLRNLQEQICAVKNLARFVAKDGTLLLLEGFKEGFENLTDMRRKLGLSDIEPAKINYYCDFKEMVPVLKEYFEIVDDTHLGSYDFFTRVVYPMLAEPQEVKHNTSYHTEFLRIAQAFNPEEFRRFSRIKCLALRPKTCAGR